jgi:hypothetical protein
MKPGLVLMQKDPPHKNVALEMDSFIRLSESIPIFYNYQNINEADIFKEIESHSDYSFIASWYDGGLLNNISSLKKFEVPIILHIGDCWKRLADESFRKVCEKHQPDILLSQNNCAIPAIRSYLNNNEIKFIWSPMGIDPTVMKDYSKVKEYDIGFSGKFSNYDDRISINQWLSKSSVTNKIRYKRFEKEESIVDYAKNMNRCWLSYSSLQNSSLIYYNGIFIGNNFSRNFEICACNTGLITRKFGDAGMLGFVDGYNCFLYDDIRKFPMKISAALSDKDELRIIIKRGHDLIHDKYTIDTLTKKLIKNIERVL